MSKEAGGNGTDDFPDNVAFNKDALNDFAKLDGSVRKRVMAGIKKTAKNPLPKTEGGYGKPLGKKRNVDLTGYLEVKYRDDGIRCIYRCYKDSEKDMMNVIIISVRKDEKVYKEAKARIDNL